MHFIQRHVVFFFSFDSIIFSTSFSDGTTVVQSVQQGITSWMAEELEFDSRQGQEVFLYSTA
jgi:hypothetical protein